MLRGRLPARLSSTGRVRMRDLAGKDARAPSRTGTPRSITLLRLQQEAADRGGDIADSEGFRNERIDEARITVGRHLFGTGIAGDDDQFRVRPTPARFGRHLPA